MKLEQMLREQCPNGVEYVKLGEVCTITKGKTPIQKAIPGEYPLVVTTSERKSCNTYQFDRSAVCIPLVSSRGHGVASLNHVYFQSGKFALGNILCAVIPNDESILSANFLYHYLEYKKDTLLVPLMKGGANVSLHIDDIQRVKIPLPPIEVQNRTIEILDKFVELSETLSKELLARRNQYKYYRDLLLDFGVHGGGTSECQRKTISDLFIIKRGKVISKDFIKDNVGDYPVYSSQTENNGELGRISTYDFEGEYLTWTTDGANAGSVFYRNEKFNITNVCGLLQNNSSDIITRFAYYVLILEAPKYVSKGMGNPKLMSNVMGRIKIPVPPIEEQERIVSILNRFDKLCNDISEGLPAEIEARRKQYEYYRDKLISFNEA